MTYRGEQVFYRPPIGIKPTEAHHKQVKAWSVMGIGVREICARLGPIFNLGKPMSRLSLYNHFRDDIVHVRGRKPLAKKKNPVMEDPATKLRKMLALVDAKSGRKKPKVYPEKKCRKCGAMFKARECDNCRRLYVNKKNAEKRSNA